MAPRGEATPTLSLDKVSKTFGATRALDSVSIDVLPGEVHGLLGANGSGKSTLIKILAGYHAPDSGARMLFNGESVTLPLAAADFRRLGMSFVHQDLGLVPSMTVLENLRLSQIALSKRWYVSWKNEIRAARTTLASFDLDIEPWQRIDELSAVDRALLVIVRAFEEIRVIREKTGRPGLILLDEPTPFLPEEGVEKLFALMRRIASSGSSVIFITHDIDEIMNVTDRVTVLRDGCVSGETPTRHASREQMIEMIIGRRLDAKASVRRVSVDEFTPFLRIDDVAATGLRVDNLTVGEGEIVGLSGLIGSGYDRLLYSVFGAVPSTSGSLTFNDDRRLNLPDMTPAQAISENFALLPADRPRQSGVGSLRVFENMMLPDLENYFSGGFLRGSRMRTDASEWGARFEVRPNEPGLNLAALSGGNAQKVLIARWMKRGPRLLLLDEPTQGVDVGTRAMIINALREAASKGMTILCASSDAEQLADLCHRVLVFSKGSPMSELSGDDVTRERITQACYDSDTLLSRKADAPGSEAIGT